MINASPDGTIVDIRVIPRASTEQLVGRFAPGIASVTEFPRAGHSDIAQDPAYLPAFIAP